MPHIPPSSGAGIRFPLHWQELEPTYQLSVAMERKADQVGVQGTAWWSQSYHTVLQTQTCGGLPGLEDSVPPSPSAV